MYDLSKIDYKDWEEVGNINDTWNYQREFEDAGRPESGVAIRGVFVETQHDVGPNKSKLHVFEDPENHKDIAVWGNTVLDNRFEHAKEGEEWLVIYLGKSKSRKGNKEYNNFKIYHMPKREGLPNAAEDQMTDQINLSEIPF